MRYAKLLVGAGVAGLFLATCHEFNLIDITVINLVLIFVSLVIGNLLSGSRYLSGATIHVALEAIWLWNGVEFDTRMQINKALVLLVIAAFIVFVSPYFRSQ